MRVPPTLAAQQAATLQRFSAGRVLLNVVSGSDDREQHRFDDWFDHDERYARVREFLQIVNSVWRQDAVDFTSKCFRVEDARVSGPPDPLPQNYFGGSSPPALAVAAEFVDVYLTSVAAWAVADELVNELSPEQIANALSCSSIRIRRPVPNDRIARRPPKQAGYLL